jgi:hypothetical protein
MMRLKDEGTGIQARSRVCLSRGPELQNINPSHMRAVDDRLYINVGGQCLMCQSRATYKGAYVIRVKAQQRTSWEGSPKAMLTSQVMTPEVTSNE